MGDGCGQRGSFVGYQWGTVDEIMFWRSNTSTIGASLIDEDGLGWWNSSGHRSNMTSANYAVFDQHAMNDNNHWTTQTFTRPSFQSYTHIFGLFLEGTDNRSDWTPLHVNEHQRQGLRSIPFGVYPAGGTQPVASSVTLANASFAASVGADTYEVECSLPGGHLMVTQVAVANPTNHRSRETVQRETREMNRPHKRFL